MPFRVIGRFPTGDVGTFPRTSEFKRPTTFYDKVTFVGANSTLYISGGNLFMESPNSSLVIGASDGARTVINNTGLSWLDQFDSPLEEPSDNWPFFVTAVDGDTLGSYPADTNMTLTLRMAGWTGNDSPWMRFNSDNWSSGSNPYVQFGVGAFSDSLLTITPAYTLIESTVLTLPVKTTTGDPSGPVDGDMYVNTFDNKIRVYADAAWRDLATW